MVGPTKVLSALCAVAPIGPPHRPAARRLAIHTRPTAPGICGIGMNIQVPVVFEETCTEVLLLYFIVYPYIEFVVVVWYYNTVQWAQITPRHLREAPSSSIDRHFRICHATQRDGGASTLRR